MVDGDLEGCSGQHAGLLSGDPMPSDLLDFPIDGHYVCYQHDVPNVNGESLLAQCVGGLVYYGVSTCLYAQNLCYLVDVVGLGSVRIYAIELHNLPQC